MNKKTKDGCCGGNCGCDHKGLDLNKAKAEEIAKKQAALRAEASPEVAESVAEVAEEAPVAAEPVAE